MARRIALVVGVNQYAHMPSLPAAKIDAQRITDVLTTRGEFDVTSLEDPDHRTFGRALTDLYGDQSLLPDDLLLLYFAGHGLNSHHRDRFYLATTDTDPDYPDTTAIDAEIIKSSLNNTFAKAKVVILDSCFSGHMGDGLRSRGDGRVGIRVPLDRKGTFVLTATDRTTYAYEDPRAKGESALFTSAVVDALSGAAKDADGDHWISIQDVAAYVTSSEKVLAHQKPLAFAHSVNGAIPLARTEAGAPSAEPTPETFRSQRPEPPDDPHAMLDSTMWRRLLRYYTDCLKRESGLSNWFGEDDGTRARLWGGGAETIFTGPAGPATVPDSIARFADRDDDMSYFYGYPLILRKDGRKYKYSPILVTPIEVENGVAQAGLVELNIAVLSEWGLEDGEIDQLKHHLAKTFRPGQPEQLTRFLDTVASTYGIKIVQNLDPKRLSDTLEISPVVVEGLHNLGVVWRDDGSKTAVQSVIKDLGVHALKKVGDFNATALAAFTKPGKADEPISSMPLLVNPGGPLNEAQEATIESAMTRRLTVATGPPGTGKTALVTALVATAEAAGQSVLVASTNHKAVDNVCDKLTPIASGMMIRTGPKDRRDEESATLSRLIDAVSAPLDDRRILEGELRLNQERITRLRASIDTRSEVEADLYAVHRHLDQIRSDAVFPTEALLPLEDRRLARLGAKVRRSLKRWPMGIFSRHGLRAEYGVSTELDRSRMVQLIETEQLRREHRATLATMPALEPIWDELNDKLRTRVSLSETYSEVVTANRLKDGEAIIRARIDRLNRGESNWKDFKRALMPLPGWAVNGHSSTAIVPTPALFDLVIIDEAAQCATPYVLALLMRARRVLIIGDPNQLKPVVKLSKESDDDLRRAAGLGSMWMRARHLGFVNETIYSAAAAAVTEELMLDEHYRCDPDIIASPNRMVYQDRLAVMTDRTGLRMPADPPEMSAVEIVNVAGVAERPKEGSCRNPIEAHEVVEHVVQVLAENNDVSLGVITPFKAQERLLKELLSARGLGKRVQVGTIHTFQGGECDVIIISPVAAEQVQHRTGEWVRGETNLWNVAITRAMSRLIVVCDREWWSGRSGLLSRLIDGGPAEVELHEVDTALADRLQDSIMAANLPVSRRSASVAGQPCSFLIDDGVNKLAVHIDAAATPDGRRLRQLVARQNLVAGAGYLTVRIPAWRILAHAESVVEELADLLRKTR